MLIFGTYHIQLLAIDDGIVGRAAEAGAVGRLVDILLGDFLFQVDKAQASVDTIVGAAVVHHHETLGNGNLDGLTVVVVTQTACEKSCARHQGQTKYNLFLFHCCYNSLKLILH